MTLRDTAETVSVVYIMFMYSFGGACGVYVLYCLLWSKYWYLSVAYVSWVIYDNRYRPKGKYEKMVAWKMSTFPMSD